jgi:hypothetical protein
MNKKKVIGLNKRNRKRTNILIGTLFILIFLCFWYSKYYLIQNHGRYGIAITKYELSHGRYEKVDYQFKAENEKLYKGTFKRRKIPNSKIKCPNGKYLVIYSTKYPSWNIFLEDKEIDINENIDSLISLTVNPQNWSWKDL